MISVELLFTLTASPQTIPPALATFVVFLPSITYDCQCKCTKHAKTTFKIPITIIPLSLYPSEVCG